MKQPYTKMALLESAPIPTALFAMGLPTMFGMMINALYNLVDAYFVGGLGTSPAGAISIAFPLGQVIVGLGLLFGNGAASYLSRLLGQGDKKTANQVASTALYSSIFVGAILILAAMIFLNPILTCLGATDSIRPYAMSYSRIILMSSIFNVFNVTMNNIVTSEGAAKTTMLVLLSGAILNVILDPILIYGFHLGVAGAALATATSQFVSTLLYLGYAVGKKSAFRFHLKDCRFTKKIMFEILKIGIPTMIFQLLTSLSIAMINDQAKNYGDSVIAAMLPVIRMISVGSLMVFGFMKGFQAIAGYCYGAKQYARLREAIHTAVLWSTLFCVIYGLITAIFSTEIVSLFTKVDLEMLLVGQKALRANGITFMLFGFYTVYSSLFLAMGKAKSGFFLGACRQGICLVPVILILPTLWGLSGILFAQPIADILSAVITVLMAVPLHQDLTRKIPGSADPNVNSSNHLH